MQEQPTVGRIVHFYDHERARDHRGIVGPYPAMVTAVHEKGVDLTIFPVGFPPVAIDKVPHNSSHPNVYWVWPPRE